MFALCLRGQRSYEWTSGICLPSIDTLTHWTKVKVTKKQTFYIPIYFDKMSRRLTSSVVSWSPSRQHFTLSPKQPSGLNEVEMKNLILENVFPWTNITSVRDKSIFCKNSILVLILQGQSLVRRTIFIYQTNKKGGNLIDTFICKMRIRFRPESLQI